MERPHPPKTDPPRADEESLKGIVWQDACPEGTSIALDVMAAYPAGQYRVTPDPKPSIQLKVTVSGTGLNCRLHTPD